MRAAFLESDNHIRLIDVPRPGIEQDDQVLIRVETVGICGSELHAFRGSHPFRKAPVILGHEAAGRVVEAGSAVSRFAPGDRIFLDPQAPCGECAWCRSGNVNLCPDKKVLGTADWPGAFGEYVVAPQAAVFPLPDSLSYAQGSLIEPLTVAVHVARRAGIKAGQSVAVLGSGSIGGLVCGVSRAMGADPIITADIRQHCLDAACERLGATHDFLLPDERLGDRVGELTQGRGVDVVVIAADDVQLANQAVAMARRRARIVLVALLTHAPLQLAAFDIIRKEIEMIGSTMADYEDVRRALELAVSGRVDVEGILTHRLPIEAAERGMQLADSKADGAIKVILEFGS